MRSTTGVQDEQSPLDQPKRTMHLVRRAIAVAVLALAGLVPLIANAIPASANSWVVSITASKTTLWPNEQATLTATSNTSPGSYWLRVYDNTAHTFVGSPCKTTTCQVSVSQSIVTSHEYFPVVTDGSPTLNWANVQAYSGGQVLSWTNAIGVSLAASPTTVPVGTPSTLTATASRDYGQSPYYLEIFDATTSTYLTQCNGLYAPYGNTCPVSVNQAVATTHKFVAFVSSFGTSYPPPNVQATSNLSFVTWANTRIRVSLSTDRIATRSTVNLTATANVDVTNLPYYIEIFDENGTLVKSCGIGSSCAVAYSPSFLGSYLVAFVTYSSGTLPPVGAQASSNVVYAYSYLA